MIHARTWMTSGSSPSRRRGSSRSPTPNWSSRRGAGSSSVSHEASTGCRSGPTRRRRPTPLQSRPQERERTSTASPSLHYSGWRRPARRVHSSPFPLGSSEALATESAHLACTHPSRPSYTREYALSALAMLSAGQEVQSGEGPLTLRRPCSAAGTSPNRKGDALEGTLMSAKDLDVLHSVMRSPSGPTPSSTVSERL